MNTFAVGVGEGEAVGDPLGTGVGEATSPGVVDELWEQPPVPTIAAAVAHATSAMTRSERLESDIEGIPFTNSFVRRPRAATEPFHS
jgi:hypothetical protein